MAPQESIATLRWTYVRWLAVALVGGLGQRGSGADEFEFFESRIRPVLVERCYGCHSGKNPDPAGGLRLDSREGGRSAGRSGRPAVVPGHAEASELMAALRSAEGGQPTQPP
ncbi:MAG TPA: c-type cytochrome domain-containing protein, partial [Candidatus Saccharimonadales bacterium]|nr:c-type cytochrome domain-containing protein [Candidatus Saccharimonadales bacterium]